MNGNAGPKVTVLYKISNVKGEEGAYNAFELTGPAGGVSLASVKDKCHALRILNSAGASGYHWRVRVDDKARGSNGSTPKASQPQAPPKYSWWDIQDEAAKLPLKHAGFTELQNLLSPTRGRVGVVDTSQTPKGVVRTLGKAMNKVAATVEGNHNQSSTFDGGPKVPILIFKLLDVVKLHNEYSHTAAPSPVSTYQSRAHAHAPAPAHAPPASAPAPHKPQTVRRQHSSSGAQPQPQPQRQPARQQRQPSNQRPQGQPQPQRPAAEGSLMDFGPGPSRPHHSNSAPPSFGASTPAPPSNETRAQKLKREYEKKKNTQNRVWDDVDQRWVTVEATNGTPVHRGSTSAPPGAATGHTHTKASAAASSKPKVKGIRLDQVNTVGKSATVAAAVQTRVNEMEASKKIAVDKIREREDAKKMADAEEDLVRQRLEPTIKAWSEEHGKKKQLRALLASLHTILWEGAKWKEANLGELLDDKKCKLAFHKASRVVHPDKTTKLPAEQRFLAKRIFDALSQAKTEFDQ